MLPETIETKAHTSQDGMLNLSVNIGVADTDVAVTISVRPLPLAAKVDANGWPIDFFEHVAGSMPELERGPQGEFEERLPIE